ncbi:dnaj subfamily c member 14 [Holotrichia oblita]|uniref:Dnaj subfamily c member 14 n=1 Tax=Holotrichia oblita TaxID=644536 RepID=A0ACB9T513_HOLOL|nr:dnaj subfamily c member 14 [Holotrichia oblita]
MTDANRKSTGGAVEQIMRNMTSDIHNVDGQYRQLGYISPTQHPETWNIPVQNSYMNSYNMCNNDTQIPFQNMNNQSISYGYPNHYTEQFDKSLTGNDLYGYNVYSNLQNGIGMQDMGNMYPHDYKYMSNVYHHQNMHSMPEPGYIPNHHDLNTMLNNTNVKNHHQPSNKLPLIDNLVGNWTPNTSGTYSPFGNVATTNASNIFESDNNCLNNVNMERKYNQDCLEKSSDEIKNFSFNRDTKRPRIIAEVKPMRPTYSDVLLKTVPNTNIKSGKIENDKFIKANSVLNRASVNHEVKDLNCEKSNQLPKSTEKIKENKPGQLNRKWVSLDNVSESFNDIKSEISEVKNKKTEEVNINKNNIKNLQKKSTKNNSDHVDTDSSSNNKNESGNSSKNSVKRGLKSGSKQKNYDSSSNNDKPPSKRNQRNRKRDGQLPLDVIREKLRIYLENWWKFCVGFLFWLWNLVSDVFSLSLQILRDG